MRGGRGEFRIVSRFPLAPLKDQAKFAAPKLDPELGTIVWEDGADLAPEFLRDRLLVPSDLSAATAVCDKPRTDG
jgi:hypothetical protein